MHGSTPILCGWVRAERGRALFPCDGAAIQRVPTRLHRVPTPIECGRKLFEHGDELFEHGDDLSELGSELVEHDSERSQLGSELARLELDVFHLGRLSCRIDRESISNESASLCVGGDETRRDALSTRCVPKEI